jgi:hypothetical protein
MAHADNAPASVMLFADLWYVGISRVVSVRSQED